MEAFSESRFVCSAMLEMTSTICDIFSPLSPSFTIDDWMLSVLFVISVIWLEAVEIALRPVMTCSRAPFAARTIASVFVPASCACAVISDAFTCISDEAVACSSTPFAMLTIESATWFEACALC